MQVSISNQKNIDAFIKNLEVHIRQLAKQLSEHGSGSFSANTQVNPKELCKMITTRKGIVVGLKDDGECSEKNKNKGVVEKNDEKERDEKEKEQNDEVVTNEEVEEKVVSK